MAEEGQQPCALLIHHQVQMGEQSWREFKLHPQTESPSYALLISDMVDNFLTVMNAKLSADVTLARSLSVLVVFFVFRKMPSSLSLSLSLSLPLSFNKDVL